VHRLDAFCLARLGMMVALLGILKAGGAYVPLDPKLPDDRLRFMLADVKPRLVLTEDARKFIENAVGRKTQP
jgi:non-ribosomal peptide synthetase component F